MQASLILSEDQQVAVDHIADWAKGARPGKAADGSLRFGGLAGTGKTTIVATLPHLLTEYDLTFAAPTGKAATVLGRKLGKHALTIHQLIYRPNEVHCGKCPRGLNTAAECHAYNNSTCGCKVIWSHRGQDDHDKPPLFIVDESSMIDEYIYEDLINYTRDNPVLFVGDHGQLPPVNGRLNLMGNPDVRLETIHRQVADSPILRVAMMARTTGHIPLGDYGDGVRKLKRSKLGNMALDDETLFLCYTNATRCAYNQWMRQSLGLSGPPVAGEPVICLKNNWKAGVHNGLTGRIRSIEAVSGKYLATIDLEDGRVYNGVISPKQFGQQQTLLNDGVDLWDWGYCLTVHKAQGSQADRVVLFEEHLPHVGLDNWKRWLYTAVTRAAKELIIFEE